jgi:hypothetical protein
MATTRPHASMTITRANAQLAITKATTSARPEATAR